MTATPHLHLKKIIERHAFLLIFVQSLFAAVAIFISLAGQRNILSGMAASTVGTVETFISEGRMQDGGVAFSRLMPEYFSTIGIFDGQGRLMTSRASPSSESISIESVLINPRLFESSIEVPLPSLDGKVVFLYSYSNALLIGIMGWLLVSLFTFPIFFSMQKRLKNMYALVIASEKDAAIARMVQMLAHDVRKPFSMLKMTMESFAKARTLNRVREVARKSLPEIERATVAVNGLIQDVMEVGSTMETNRDAISPEALLYRALGDIFRIHESSDVAIKYSLRHKSEVHVEENKVLRVFSNILSNALQAMNGKGTLAISTEDLEECGAAFVKFSIQNSGPAIPPEHICHIFEAFFTSGKKGGTGLGLAVAHKVVTAHGGRIWCEGNPATFHFTLPSKFPPKDKDIIPLPQSSHEVKAHLAVPDALKAKPSDSAERSLENKAWKALSSFSRKFVVLLVDDEPFYREAIAELLNENKAISEQLEVAMAADADSALFVLSSLEPDLAILDVDLGSGGRNGFELAAELRRRGLDPFICIHSNRILATDHKTAIENGADAFLPKPMSRAHLLTLLCQSVAKRMPHPALTSSQEPFIAVIEDNELFHFNWQDEFPAARLFLSPEAFLEALDREPTLLQNLDCIIADNNFGEKSPHDGLWLGKQIRARGFEGSVLLSSNVSHGEEYAKVFTKEIGKDVPARDTLWELIRDSRS